MSQVRFATVRDLFDTYPSASADVGAADDGMRSLDFVRGTGAQEGMAAGNFVLRLSVAATGGGRVGVPVDPPDVGRAASRRGKNARLRRRLG